MSTDQHNTQPNDEARLQIGLRIRITAKTWNAIKDESHRTRKPIAWIVGDKLEQEFRTE